MTEPTQVMIKEGLCFIRQAHKKKDGADGLLYIHIWETGYQFLVFPSREAAEEFRKDNGIPLPRLVPKYS